MDFSSEHTRRSHQHPPADLSGDAWQLTASTLLLQSERGEESVFEIFSTQQQLFVDAYSA